MTIDSMVKNRLKEIKKIQDIKKREKEYIATINFLFGEWKTSNSIVCIADSVAKEMFTKEQYVDFQKEILHRNIRNNKWIMEQKDLAEQEKEIQKDYIKKYRVIDIKDLKEKK